MSGKNQFFTQLNWQTTSPVTGFLPANTSGGSISSGTTAGAMASTNVIYSNIIEVAKMDNIGFEFDWTGTPNGTIAIFASISGASFYAVTPSPALTQPAGSASGCLVAFNQFAYKYIYVQYTNSSSTGTLTAYLQLRDLN